jgi:hypothetical protein
VIWLNELLDTFMFGSPLFVMLKIAELRVLRRQLKTEYISQANVFGEEERFAY